MALTFAEITKSSIQSDRRPEPSQVIGKLDIYNGQVRASWEQRSPHFTANLSLARGFKYANGGTFSGDAQGWLFARSLAAKAVIHFKGFEVSPEVHAVPVVVASKPGKITPQQGQFLVTWGQQVGRDDFNRYLNACRKIKGDYPGSSGFQKSLSGWMFSQTACLALLAAFPDFDHCPELHTAKAAEPVKQVVAPEVIRDPAMGDKLRAAAASILAEVLPSGQVLFDHQKEAILWMIDAAHSA